MIRHPQRLYPRDVFAVLFCGAAMLALIMGVLVFASCAQPANPCQDGYHKNESGDVCVPDGPATCGVQAGDPVPIVIEFYDVCLGISTMPDLYFGKSGTELVQVYPDTFAGVFRFILESCEQYDYQVQWISGGVVYDIYSHTSAEVMRAYSVIELTPPGGCPVDNGDADPLQPLWDCIEISHGDQDPLTAMVLCCESAAGLQGIPEIAARCSER